MMSLTMSKRALGTCDVKRHGGSCCNFFVNLYSRFLLHWQLPFGVIFWQFWTPSGQRSSMGHPKDTPCTGNACFKPSLTFVRLLRKPKNAEQIMSHTKT